MGAIRNLVNELRRRGVTVHEWDGWDGRGNQGITQIDPKGAIIHHTGSGYGSAYPLLVYGRDGLRGMLCNFSGNADGSVTVIGSGLAWHAGGGYGPNQGPLAPYANNRNYYTVGLEIVYPGTSPMTAQQYRTALVFSRTVADMFAGGNTEYVRGHFEVNGEGWEGKWDPADAPLSPIDMDRFRREARTATMEDELNLDDKFWNWDGTYETTVRHALQMITALNDLFLKTGGLPAFDDEDTRGLDILYGAHYHAKHADIDLDEVLTRLKALEERISTGTGFTLEEIAKAVVAEFKKEGN